MKTKIIPSEYEECVVLAEWLKLLQNQGKVIVYSHTAQSTYTRSWKQKSKNKLLGVNPGVPDYIIVTKDKVYFIEMKRVKGGQISMPQAQWVEALEGKKCIARVCRGFDEVKKLLNVN